MAKAINWPLAFREEVLTEDCEHERVALRLGDLYYQNHYWTPNEVVDIRVNHKKIRQAVIVGELRQCPLGSLGSEEFRRQKRSLQSVEAIRRFLAENYGHPLDALDDQTPVTIVTYKNRPINPDEVEVDDDPHMSA